MTTATEQEIEQLPPALREQARQALAHVDEREKANAEEQQRQASLLEQSQATPAQAAPQPPPTPPASAPPEQQAQSALDKLNSEIVEAQRRRDEFLREYQQMTGRYGSELQDLRRKLEEAEERIAELTDQLSSRPIHEAPPVVDTPGQEPWRELYDEEDAKEMGEAWAIRQAKRLHAVREQAKASAVTAQATIREEIKSLKGKTAKIDELEKIRRADAEAAGWNEINTHLRSLGVEADARGLDAEPAFRNTFLNQVDPVTRLTYRQRAKIAEEVGNVGALAVILAEYHRQKTGASPQPAPAGAHAPPPLASQVQPPTVAGVQRTPGPVQSQRIVKKSEFNALMAKIRAEGPRATEAERQAMRAEVEDMEKAQMEGRWIDDV